MKLKEQLNNEELILNDGYDDITFYPENCYSLMNDYLTIWKEDKR